MARWKSRWACPASSRRASRSRRPLRPRRDYPLQVAGQTLTIAALAIGNPHAVLRVPDVDAAPVATLGPLIEAHARFPRRVNVGFLQVVSRREGRLRVYERGAGETLACGTGACAAFVAGVRWGLFDAQVRLHLPGGALDAGLGRPGHAGFPHWPRRHRVRGHTRRMKKSTAKPAADADQVAAYLLLNPDFFESHPQVFEALDVPHPTGGAVSLVERQVAVLRERNRALTARLDAVIEAAHRHDDQYRKLFELATALAACRDIAGAAARAGHAPAARLRHRRAARAARTPPRRAVRRCWSALSTPPLSRPDIERSKPRCLPQSELPTVQPYLDAPTASAAILPLAAGAAPALLLLGSHDAERFSPELGTLLLERLAQLTGAHWHRLSGA